MKYSNFIIYILHFLKISCIVDILTDSHIVFPTDVLENVKNSLFPIGFSISPNSIKESVENYESDIFKIKDNQDFSNYISIQLYGNIPELFYFFTYIYIGYPPQLQSVIIDTGSSLTSSPCSFCMKCNEDHLNPYFFPDNSNTLKWLPCSDSHCISNRCFNKNLFLSEKVCSYKQAYVEGSLIEGVYFSDYFSFFDQNSLHLTVPIYNTRLGCHYKETLLFLTQKVNGIMGLFYPESLGNNTLLDRLLEKSIIQNKMFSICVGYSGGHLLFGGYNQFLHQPLNRFNANADKSSIHHFINSLSLVHNEYSPIIWTPLNRSRRYEIQIDFVYIYKENSQHILIGTQFDFGPCVIDSGTTFTYLPSNIFNNFFHLFLTFCRKHRCFQSHFNSVRNMCWNIENIKHNLIFEFPIFLFKLANTDQFITWTAQSYLQPYNYGGGYVWCLAIDENEKRQSSVFGISFLKHHNVIFDLNRNYLGIAEADCSTNSYVDETAMNVQDSLDESFYQKPKVTGNISDEDSSGILDLILLSSMAVTGLILGSYIFFKYIHKALQKKRSHT